MPGQDQGKRADRPQPLSDAPTTEAVRSASRAWRGACAPRHISRSNPGYGRDPVGNGHAAAGFSAVLALGIAAVDGGAARSVVIAPAELALGLTGFAFFLVAFLLRPAAFFLDDFLTAFFFFFDDFFFFFFFPPFFAFFFAMTSSLQVVEQKKPGHL